MTPVFSALPAGSPRGKGGPIHPDDLDTQGALGAPGKQPSQDGLSIRPTVLQLSPIYRRLRDSILRPHLRLTESRYFWEKWKHLLGPDATILIMEVRDRCNRSLSGDTGSASAAGCVLGDGCTVSANELAAACGFSRVTLWRILQREDVRQFVHVEHNYVYDRRIGKRRRTVSTYHVLMEDPLVPEDEPRLQELLASQGLTAQAQAQSHPAHAEESEEPNSVMGASIARSMVTKAPARSTFHSETEVVDNPAPKFHFETTKGGSRQKRQNVEETKLTQRLVETPTLPSQDDPHSSLRGGTPSRLSSLLGSFSPSSAKPTAPVGARTVPAPGPARPESEPDIWQKYPQLAYHIEEAETLLGDGHSRGFYINALKRLYPGHMAIWQRALGLAREQKQIRRSRGALFTRLLRTFAAEAGVSL